MRSKLRLPVAALAAAALAGCVSSSDIDSLRAQLTDLQRQVAYLQSQGSSKQEVAELQATIQQQTERLLKTEADMRVDLGSLSGQLGQLQGQLEDTNYRLSQLSQQIAAASQDLKAVRTATAPLPEAPGTLAGGTPSPTAGTSDPETLYQTAYSDYLRGAYDLALLGFRQYLDSFPETDLADNAVYWIGECFYRQQRYREAILEYERVLQNWPRSDKTASALLKKGYAQIESGHRGDGVAGLERVIQTFPNSDEANLARQKLQSLGVDSRRQR
jgi:tol-pal system protein YbgF